VARPAARYVFEALARRSEPENKLTEVFAHVLSFDEGLSLALLQRIGLDDWRAVNVQTQVATGVGLRTMDVLLTLQSDGGAVAELWCEHKVTSPFGDDQLDKYELAINRRRAIGDDVRLLVILSSDPTPDESGQLRRMGAIVRRWNDVADFLDDLLVERDRNWYRSAARRDAPAGLRVLAELAVYLQEVAGVAVIEPLDADKLAALQNIDAARDTVGELLQRVADGLHPGCAEKVYEGRTFEESWLALRALGWWNRLSGGTLYLWAAPTAWFAEDADPVPSFGVSVQVEESERRRLLRDLTLRDALDAADLRFGSYEGENLIDIGTSVPLQTLVGRSLGEQTAELLGFARTAIRSLAGCVPNGLNPNSRPKSGRTPETLNPQLLS
jgi:hypothetical protein